MPQLTSVSVAKKQHKDFDTLRPTSRLYVRPAEIGDLAETATFAVAQLQLLKLADLGIYESLSRFDQDMIQIFVRHGAIVGVYAMLFLNSEGLCAMLAGKFDTHVPNKSFLATPPEEPAGIYNWFTACPGLAAAGFGNVAEILTRERFSRADLYARPASDAGRRIMKELGYRRIECATDDLFRYVRRVNRIQPSDQSRRGNRE